MASPLPRSSGSSVRELRIRPARMCGKALATASISCGGSPSEAATSLIALRARYVSIIDTQATRWSLYASTIAR